MNQMSVNTAPQAPILYSECEVLTLIGLPGMLRSYALLLLNYDPTTKDSFLFKLFENKHLFFSV